MLVRLGTDGVIQGVKDSSGDDVSFRWLCLENEDAGHPLQIFTGHEVVVDGAYMCGADGSVPGLANIDPHSYVERVAVPIRRAIGHGPRNSGPLARLMFVTRVVKATVGFGAGVGAFKTALWQMGVSIRTRCASPSRSSRARMSRLFVASLSARVCCKPMDLGAKTPSFASCATANDYPFAVVSVDVGGTKIACALMR